jgi:hypothetical protein
MIKHLPLVPSERGEPLTLSALHLKEYVVGYKENFSLDIDWSILNLHTNGELIGQYRLSDAEMDLCKRLFSRFPLYAPTEELLSNLRD